MILRIDDLSFRYESHERFILHGINLHVQRGEYISVLGENGTGKSTLIKLMLKLLTPTNGVVINSAKRIGYVPQRKENLTNFPITVAEMLHSYRALLKEKNKALVDSVLSEVGMSDFKNALVGTLSGGQVQKVYIARCLIGEPELIILDEPSTGVDFQGQRDIYAFIKNLNTQKGVTIISVEHNLDAALLNSTKIFHIEGSHGHLCTPDRYVAEFLNPKQAESCPVCREE
ncbi:metal ABC transporter ATP-binding protein [Treponema phagedenis]|nr:metal ABC transporter ATP-binding protein [Treponema phagedenis]